MEYNSILLSVKKTLGIDPNYSDFDADIIMSINSAIHTLYQVGYVPAKNFIVEGTEETWETLADSGVGLLSLIKSYIYTKVRLLFDPPTSSFVLSSLENQLKEFEWRIYAEMEGGFDDDEQDDDSDSSGDAEDEEPDGDDGCNGNDPWEGVPGNGDDESGDEPGSDDEPEPEPEPDPEPDSGLEHLSALRRLRDEMGHS